MHTMTGMPSSGRWAAAAQSPSVLLVVTGTLIGLNFPLGKLGGQAGVLPAMWALLISFGASAAMLPVLLLRGALQWPTPRLIRYSVISSLVSFVSPNLLLFTDSTMPSSSQLMAMGRYLTYLNRRKITAMPMIEPAIPTNIIT
jgi:drug/metabolite transporter (DMT)-like permease